MGEATPPEPSQLQPVQAKDSVIGVQHLTKKFGDETAVQDVSFDVPRASIFGFIGPSGSGKTTTVRLLTGVYTPTEGQVTVLDLQSGQVQPERSGAPGLYAAAVRALSQPDRLGKP